MDEFLRKQEAVMDKYDPEKKVTLSVDEWGAWHAPLSGSNPAFLVQQNSIRDAILASLNLNIFARHADRVRMANIAQMINVLQAMILTDKGEVSPDTYLLRFQNVRSFSGRDVHAGGLRRGHLHARRRVPAAR
jgi:alpha-L-arabinofuranosidase